jgi:hypothetical protein
MNILINDLLIVFESRPLGWIKNKIVPKYR